MRENDVRPGPVVMAVGVAVALGCVGFAVVNVVFEATGRFDEGRYSEYSVGLSVVDWLVTGLKVVGATVAVLAVVQRQRVVSAKTLTVLLWGAFATLAIYVAGSLVEAVAIIAGVTGSRESITPASVAYVVGFLAAASGFGVLAVSHYRRHRPPRRYPTVGVLGAPALIGLVLVGVPLLLTQLRVMPAT